MYCMMYEHVKESTRRILPADVLSIMKSLFVRSSYVQLGELFMR